MHWVFFLFQKLRKVVYGRYSVARARGRQAISKERRKGGGHSSYL